MLAQAQAALVLAQRLAGVRRGVRLHVLRRAAAHHLAAGLAALGAQVDDPVGRAHHVEVVLDDHQRMAGVEQLAQRAHQLGDVVEVQPGGRLVEQEQLALLRRRLARARSRIGQEAGQLEPLRLAARQRGHRLAQAHVVQADIDDRLQPRDHLAVGLEPVRRLGHGQLQHVGHADSWCGPRTIFASRISAAEALAVAVRAAQVDVAEELHLHMLEARAAAGGAAAVAGVEAEHAGGVAALARDRRLGKELADLVPGTDIAGRVGARGLADRALVDEDRVAQPVGAEQPVVLARRFGGLAEMPRQRRVQHVLHQRALARAGHARHHHQALQRQRDASRSSGCARARLRGSAWAWRR